jgi:hypothetical protein
MSRKNRMRAARLEVAIVGGEINPKKVIPGDASCTGRRHQVIICR